MPAGIKPTRSSQLIRKLIKKPFIWQIFDPIQRAMNSRSNRNFQNAFSDFNGQQILLPTKKLPSNIEDKLKFTALNLLSILEREYVPNKRDFSVYTGTAGLSLMYYHLFMKLKNDSRRKEYLAKSVEYITWSLKYANTSEVTFLCGLGGPLAIGAVVYHADGNDKESQHCLNSLLALNKPALYKSSLPDELLYGRVGFLYSLLFVRYHLGPVIGDELLTKVADVVLESGHKYAQSHNIPSPLMYEWYDTIYLGAAHGITGIISILLMLKDSEAVSLRLESWIKKTIDYLMTLKFPSGNYPAAIEPHSMDELVHWCHGSPGWIYMYLLAYKTFGDAKYLSAAEECTEVVWRRGLLRKGYGLCHGVAGNAYSLLAMYNGNGDERHLYRALKFAEWIYDYGKHGCRIADAPYSLFEGMAGTIFFLVDLLDPTEAKFPAFQL